jgi:hypothetical protein
MFARIRSAFKRQDPYIEVLRNAEARLTMYESRLLKFDIKNWEQQAARDRRSLESVHLECWKRLMTLHSWGAYDLLEIAYTQSVLISKRGWLRLCLCAAAIQVLYQRIKASEGWRRVLLGIATEREAEYQVTGKFSVLPALREGVIATTIGTTADLEARLPVDIERFCATAEELVRDFSIAKRLQKKISKISDRLVEIDADFTAQQPTLRELPKDVRKTVICDLVNAEVKVIEEEEELAKETSEVLESLLALPDAHLPLHPSATSISFMLRDGLISQILDLFPATASLMASDVRRGIANAQEESPNPVSPQLVLTISTFIYHGILLSPCQFSIPSPTQSPLTERSTSGTYYTPLSAALSEVHSGLDHNDLIHIPHHPAVLEALCRLHNILERETALNIRRLQIYKRFERIIADQRTKDGRLLQRGLQRMFVDKDFDGGVFAFDLPRFLCFSPGAGFAAETRAAMGIISPEMVASGRFVNSHSPKIVLADGIDGSGSGSTTSTGIGIGNRSISSSNSGNNSVAGISIEMGLMGNSSPPKRLISKNVEETQDAYDSSRPIVKRPPPTEVAAIRYGRPSSSSSSSSSTLTLTENSRRTLTAQSHVNSPSTTISSPTSPTNTTSRTSRHVGGVMPTPSVVRMFLVTLVKEFAISNNIAVTVSVDDQDTVSIEKQRKALRSLVDRLVFARLHSFVHAGVDVAPIQPWTAAESPSTVTIKQTGKDSLGSVSSLSSTDSDVPIPTASSLLSTVVVADSNRIYKNATLAYLGGPQRPTGSTADVMLRRDRIWLKKKVLASRLTAVEIGLPLHFITPLLTDVPGQAPFSIPASLLSSLDDLSLPITLCKVIVTAVDCAISEAKARFFASSSSSSSSTSNKTGDVTAEDLIPLLIYITCKSLWQRPHATLSYVSAYAVGPGFGSSNSSLGGRESYLFTVLQSCISWVCQRSSEDITNESGITNINNNDNNKGNLIDKGSTIKLNSTNRTTSIDEVDFENNPKQLFSNNDDQETTLDDEKGIEEEDGGGEEDDEYISLMMVDEFERDIEEGSQQKLKETINNQARLEGALEMFA